MTIPTRELGRSGLRVCAVGLGCMGMSDFYGAGDDAESTATIHRALDQLPALQLANRETGAVHAAAWASPDGEIILAREDVGRHNALDKLIGAMAKAKTDPDSGFAVITSRCSFNL